MWPSDQEDITLRIGSNLDYLTKQTVVGAVRQVAGGLGDAVIVIVDASGGDDIVHVVEAEAQGAQLLNVRLVALDRGAGYLYRVTTPPSKGGGFSGNARRTRPRYPPMAVPQPEYFLPRSHPCQLRTHKVDKRAF